MRRTTLREVKMLRMLRQSNIVELKEAFRRKGKLYLVFEYVEKTLLEVLEARRGGLNPEEVRQYIYQLVQAVNWIHSHDAVHRDIKPENLLISSGAPGSSVGQLKLCDFGFARQLPANPADVSITDYVSTRWYRSPELLLGSSHYSKEVDIWAIGCIMAELSTGQPLFPGDSDVDQLYIVQKMLGPLCRQHDILFLTNSRFAGLTFPDMSHPMTLDAKFHSALPADALDFLKGTLAMNPSQRLTCLQCLDHPYLADLARKDPRWQAQRKQLQASVAAAAGAATGSIRCDSSTSSATHVDDSACSSGPTTADARPGSLPSAVSPGSGQQQGGAFNKQGPAAAGVPRLQLGQQPGIKAFPASNLGGTTSTSQSTTVTPRSSVGHVAGGPASKQRQQQQQHVRLQSLGSSKHLAAPKAQPVIKKQPSKGHTSQAAAGNAGSRGMPSLSLGPAKPGQLQVETTPRGRAPAAAASPAAAFGAPITRAKAASMAAVSQAYGQPAPHGAAAAAAAAAAAGGPGAGDVDMGEADSPATSRRRKRLASGGAGGATSLRNGSRQGEAEAEEQQTAQQGPRSPMITLPPAAGSGAAAGVRRQQGGPVSSQQQWGGGPGRHAGGYGPSRMEVDVCTDVGSKNSSRPQSPLTRSSATGGTSPYGLTAPVWRDASCDAGPAQHQPQGLKPAPGGSSRWGAGLGVSGGMGSPQAASPGGSRGPVKGSAWGQAAAEGGSGHMLQHGSFGVAATAIGSSWSDDAATAAGATLGLQAGLAAGPGSSISTRSSLAASALPVFADALSGLQAHGGGHAPVSSSLASGGLYGRGSMVGPQAGGVGSSGSAGPGSRYPAAPGLQLEEARASLAAAAGGHQQQQQQQQYSPSHQPYLHQHLYH